MAQPDDDSESRATARTIEACVRALGVDPATVRSSTPAGATVWTLKRGSAAVAIFLRPARAGEAGAFVRVIAPIGTLPSGDTGPLLRHLLELNARGLSSAAFGLQESTVVVISERPARGLDEAEMSFILRAVGTVADHYDDDLRTRFGLVAKSA